MKGQNQWSYAPYRPFLWDVGDIYICRIAPSATTIHLEWLSAEENSYEIFCRKRGDEAFAVNKIGSLSEWIGSLSKFLVIIVKCELSNSVVSGPSTTFLV